MDVSAALGAGWARVINVMGRGKFVDGMGIDPKTIGRALSGTNTPELHNAFNALLPRCTAWRSGRAKRRRATIWR